MKEKTRKLLRAALGVMLVICMASIAVYIVNDRKELERNKNLSLEIGNSTDIVVKPGQDGSQDDVRMMEKYVKLYEENQDFIGWLTINDTYINNPVMFTPQEPEKYLYKDFYEKKSNQGTLFLDGRTDLEYSDNLIIYGHNNERTTAMFSTLHKFSKEEYWKEHPYIFFDTLTQVGTYEIVGAFLAETLPKEEEGFRYYRFINAWTEAEFNEFINYVHENAIYDTGVELQFGDQLLTLSTCSYHTKNGRFAIVARKIMSDEERELRLLEKELKLAEYAKEK